MRAASYGSFGKIQEAGDLGLGEAVPEDKADEFLIIWCEQANGCGNCSTIRGVVLVGGPKLIPESVVQGAAAAGSAPVCGKYSARDSEHPHARLGVVKRQVRRSPPDHEEGVVEEVG